MFIARGGWGNGRLRGVDERLWPVEAVTSDKGSKLAPLRGIASWRVSAASLAPVCGSLLS